MFLGVLVLATVSGNRPFEWYEHQGGLSLSIVVCSIFLSILYGELAMWLGIGKKWTLTSCAVLGANAMFWESFGIPYAVTVMLPVQFAAPFAVGWWFTKRKCNHRYAATAFLVFAISPVALYTLLSLVALSTAAAVFAWSSVFGLLLMFVVPTALASLLYRKLAKGVGSGRKWLVVSCLVLATCAAIPFVPLLLMFVVPMVLASLLYCKLARRSGIGWKWMLVSCTVLAVYAATQSSQGCHLFEYYDTAGQYHFCVGLWTCITLIQLAVPLVVGWRFMRREHDQGQLQLAC